MIEKKPIDDSSGRELEDTQPFTPEDVKKLRLIGAVIFGDVEAESSE